LLTALTLAITLAATPVQTEWIETDAAPIEVMVLGSYHFTGGGQDLHNPQVDDHLSPQRQAEITDVLDALADFAPTKVMVELTPDHEAEFNAAYQAYLAGERPSRSMNASNWACVSPPVWAMNGFMLSIRPLTWILKA